MSGKSQFIYRRHKRAFNNFALNFFDENFAIPLKFLPYVQFLLP